MSTYLIKHGGKLITQVYYGPNEAPEVGNFLKLAVIEPNENVLSNDAPAMGVNRTFKIVRISESASGLQDEGQHAEPTIFVEPV